MAMAHVIDIYWKALLLSRRAFGVVSSRVLSHFGQAQPNQ